jgi:superfamily II DNA helicase RecQ
MDVSGSRGSKKLQLQLQQKKKKVKDAVKVGSNLNTCTAVKAGKKLSKYDEGSGSDFDDARGRGQGRGQGRGRGSGVGKRKAAGDYDSDIDNDEDDDDKYQDFYANADGDEVEEEVEASSGDQAQREGDEEEDDIATSMLNSEQRRELISWLEAYRLRWAKWWHYLPNTAITEISECVPQSIEELAEVSGVGESRARNEGQEILATIYAYLEGSGLLHLYPRLKKPTIADCPSWRDPMSIEAEQVRTQMHAHICAVDT